MKTIWKYEVGLGQTTITIPVGSIIVSAGLDPATGGLAVWAEVESDSPTETLEITVAGTGKKRPRGSFVGSVMQGPFMWHIYEGVEG